VSAAALPAEDCLVCAKHHGGGEQPVGGYIVADDNWRVSHAPPTMAPLGQLVVESARHLRDYADMTPVEAADWGRLLRSLYRALAGATGAERISTVALLEGPHFQAWVVPRPPGVAERGLAYLELPHSAAEADVLALVAELRGALGAA
jgi:diadenosine tetraphosphate (Ap4A) HIT family hydrolase